MKSLFLVLVSSFTMFQITLAQSTAKQLQYYVSFNNVATKASIKDVKDAFNNHSEIVSVFMNRTPAVYFVLTSKVALTQSRVQHWLPSNYTITEFKIVELTKEFVKEKKGIKTKN